MSEFFYAGDQPQFSFFRTPKALFLNERYNSLSTDAKLLYSLLLDRMELSARNGMHDEQGRIFLYFTVMQASELLHYGENKITRLFGELEKIGLIARIRQGFGKASLIYPKKFLESHPPNRRVLNLQNKDSCASELTVPDPPKSRGSNTEYINTEISDTNLSIRMIDVDEMEERIKTQIEYDCLIEMEDRLKADEVVRIIIELMCIRTPTIRIGGTEYPTDFVHHRLSQLTCEHVEYVLDSMSSNTAKISNIKAYLTAALFNAPATLEHHIQAEINYDFAQ